MAAKKRRGLGASPETHMRRANEAKSAAESKFQQAKEAAASKKCSLSLAYLLLGSQAYGEAKADAHGADYGAFFPVMGRDDAEEAFRKNCVAATGLKGLGRTPKRRPARRNK
jgi:hypothetical protein